MKNNTVHETKKIKLSPKQFEKIRGSADAHKFIWDESEQKYVQTIRIIRGLAKALGKAKKFVLRVDTDHGKRLYLAHDGFVYSTKEAIHFSYGFDEPTTKQKEWTQRTKLTLKIEPI